MSLTPEPIPLFNAHTIEQRETPGRIARRMARMLPIYGLKDKSDLFPLSFRFENGETTSYFGSCVDPGYQLIGVREFTCLVEVNERGVITGISRMEHYFSADDDFYREKPMVGFTKTRKEFRGQGWATHRLRMLAGAAWFLYGFELHSGTIFVQDAAEKAWQHLVRDGQAEPTEGGFEAQRYRIVRQNPSSGTVEVIQ